MLIFYQYLCLATGLFYLYYGGSTYLSNLPYNKDSLILYTALAICCGAYSFSLLIALSFPWAFVLAPLGPFLGTLCWQLYIEIIDKYFKINTQTLIWCKRFFFLFLVFFLVDFVLSLFIGQSIVFAFNVQSPNLFYFRVNPEHNSLTNINLTLIGKISLGLLALVINFSAIYCLIKIYKHEKRDNWIVAGLILTLLCSTNDLIIGSEVFYYLFPLAMLGYTIEVIRFKTFLQKELNNRVDALGTEVLKNSKLVEIGLQTASINHEIKNSLSVISNVTTIIQRKNQDKEIKMLLGLIQKHQNRIIDIISTYSKVTSHSNLRNKINVLSCLLEIVEIIKPKLKLNKIELKMQIDKDHEIEFNESNLFLIFSNLITNSVDALKDQEDKWILISSKSEEKKLIIEFSDSGPGIDKNIENQIFQRQFTTKTTGQSTGLGLYLIQEVLHIQGGRIEYLSTKPHTTFQLSFPTINSSLFTQ